MKLLGATLALGAAVLAAETTTMALHAGVWWLASLTVLAFWPLLAAVTGLVWSAARQDMGPRPSLMSMPDQLNPAERDAWAELERRLGGEGR